MVWSEAFIVCEDGNVRIAVILNGLIGKACLDLDGHCQVAMHVNHLQDFASPWNAQRICKRQSGHFRAGQIKMHILDDQTKLKVFLHMLFVMQIVQCRHKAMS